MKMLSASALALTVGISGAYAQDDELRQTEIVVTTQKRAENLSEVPVNITAYDAEALDRLGIQQFDELSAFVPGLLIQEQSPNNPGFVIRGITSDSGAATGEPRVAVFQDGVSISKSRGSYIELYDVERIETAKGPQATLFGRGALNGAVNVIQRKADASSGPFSGYAELGVGNEGAFTAQGAMNFAIKEDVLAVRLAGIHKERDGIVENVLTDQGDLNGEGVDAYRVSIAYDPTPDWSFDFLYNYQEDDYPGTAFKSGSIPPPGGDTSPFTPAALNTFGGLEGGRPLGLERETESFTLLADWDINDQWALSSITGQRRFDSSEIFDPDGTALPLFAFAENAKGDQFSQEFRLDYDNGDRVKAFVGVSYFEESGFQSVPLGYDEATVQALFLAAPTAAFIDPLLPMGLPGDTAVDRVNAFFGSVLGAPVDITSLSDPFGFSVGASALSLGAGGGPVPLKGFHEEVFVNFGETEAIDIFGDISVAATDRLELTAGLRYTTEDKTSGIVADVVNGPTLTPVAGANGGLLITPTPGGAPVFESDTFDGWTWRLAARYAVTDDINIYGSYARGRRPDVIDATAPSNFDVLPAEEVDSFEAGAKAFFLGGDLSVDGSVFFYMYENFQTTDITDTGEFVTINAGEAEALGFEAQVTWIATENVQLGGNYGYNDAEFTTGAREGNVFRLSPEHSVSLYADLHKPAFGGEVYLRPTYTYQSEIFFDDDNDLTDAVQDERQDGYGLVNLRAGIEYEGWSLEAFATNLFDEEYIIDAGNTGDAFGIPTFIRGNPQLYGASVRIDF